MNCCDECKKQMEWGGIEIEFAFGSKLDGTKKEFCSDICFEKWFSNYYSNDEEKIRTEGCGRILDTDFRYKIRCGENGELCPKCRESTESELCINCGGKQYEETEVNHQLVRHEGGIWCQVDGELTGSKFERDKKGEQKG